MILECPSCQNRYLVDPRALGGKGRTVRCAKCKNEWFTEPPQNEPEEDVLSIEDVAVSQQEIPPIPEGSSVPAIAAARGVPASLKFATVGLGVLFVLLSMVFFHGAVVSAVPALEGVYASMGMYSTKGVVFAGLEYEKQRPEDVNSLKDNHVFRGYLVNTSAEPRKLPNILITMQGKDGALLRRHSLKKNTVLQPGESLRFNKTISTSPESLRHVIIENGSPSELK